MTNIDRKLWGERPPDDPSEAEAGSSFSSCPAESLSFTIDLKRLPKITEPGFCTLDVSRISERDNATVVHAEALTVKIVP
jgi:hypothetical protein